MAVNGEAVQQVQHQQNITSSEQMMPRFKQPRSEEKAGKGADNRRQMRCVGGDDRGDADIEQQKKSKLWVCGVIK